MHVECRCSSLKLSSLPVLPLALVVKLLRLKLSYLSIFYVDDEDVLLLSLSGEYIFLKCVGEFISGDFCMRIFRFHALYLHYHSFC